MLSGRRLTRITSIAFGDTGVIERYDFSDTAHCWLGGTGYAAIVTTIYDFMSTYTEQPGVDAGIGGGDRGFAAASGRQDTDNRVFAYDSETRTCYFYNTRFGTVHAYGASNQTVISGTLTCDGQPEMQLLFQTRNLRGRGQCCGMPQLLRFPTRTKS